MPLKDPVARRAYMRSYKNLHPEKFGRDYDRAQHANQRAAHYGAPGRITIHDVRAVKAAGRCFYCGALSGSGAYPELGIDHRIPLHLGGPNRRDNIVCCCHSCNARKHRKASPEHWSEEHDACIDCGGTERKHSGHGRCTRCYQRARKAA